MSTINSDILAFVSNYVNENGRGCPKGVLLHVGGFKAKDIAALVESGQVEAGRGSEGGLFPVGGKPAPKTDGVESLKGEAFALLREIATGKIPLDNNLAVLAFSLVERYDAQNAARRKN